MTQHTPLLYLENLEESLTQLASHIKDMTFDDFQQNILLQDAVHMRLQTIGESVSKLPVELRDTFPDVPWQKIRALRHIISHDYYSLNPQLIWHAATQDAPQLHQMLPELRRMIKSE